MSKAMQERTKYIIEQLASGRTQAELGRELNISRERVRQTIHQEYRRQIEMPRVRPIVNEYGVAILRLTRNAKGLTISKAAKDMGITGPTLCGYENGKLLPVHKAESIANYYGVDLEEVYEFPVNKAI
jgi:DNA-binding XRE family transcriptional regulator